MSNRGIPVVDLVVLTSGRERLPVEVEQGLHAQQGVEVRMHRVVGSAQPSDRCRYETIVRARNEGKGRGDAPWLMFVDDDVALDPRCVFRLVLELSRRPVFGALGADYLGEHREGRIAPHVSMGATLFRRSALDDIRFRWQEQRCECQCCCDDLRRLRWAIDYCPAAKAHHLPKREVGNSPSSGGASSDRTIVSGAVAPSVCLVVCYLGPIPRWIHHYLLSCSYNPSINFLIITDQPDFPAVPANVRVERSSRPAVCKLVKDKIGVDVDLRDPRKLCDFKPTYGHLFEELLSEYDYWGYTDLDVIYGDIRRFLSLAGLEKFDIFSARKEFLVGHFTLLRNSPRMKTLYRESADVLKTLQSPQVLSFDECGRQWLQRMRGKPLDRFAACDSMTHIVHRMVARKELTARFATSVIEWPDLPPSGWRLRWNAGRLWTVNQCREAMYFHFHEFKQRRGFLEPQAIDGKVFDISPRGFEMVKSPVEFEMERPIGAVGTPAPPSAPACSNPSLRLPTDSSRILNCGRAAAAPRILATFNRRHRRLFLHGFLASLRATGNHEMVVPVAVGLYPSEREQLARFPAVQPLFRADMNELVAKRRLRYFADIARSLPPATPVAYWDAGDVLFQSRLQPLWELVRAHPGKLLAACEPGGDYIVDDLWTNSISDAKARAQVAQIIGGRPFINSGFLAGEADTLVQYFDTVADWYDTPKMGGSTDPGDQLALNVYCHSQPERWQRVSESWNYCLWGRNRKVYHRRKDGHYTDVRGVPIHVVHGNALTLAPGQSIRRPF